MEYKDYIKAFTTLVKEKEFLTTEEVMERLRLSRATIYRRVNDGTLKCVKIGRRLRFYKRYLDIQLYSKRSDI